MKNIKPHALKTCIFLEENEFQSILSELFPGSKFSYDYEGMYVECNDEPIPTDELYDKLSEYFDVARITSIHIDDYDTIGVWIVYKTSNVFENNILPSNLAEFKGQIVDIFEDFVCANNIEIPNEDRDEEIQAAEMEGEDPNELELAVIYGRDYDVIGDVIENAVSTRFENSDPTVFENTEINAISNDIFNAFTSLLTNTNIPDNQKIRLIRKIKLTFANWGIYDLSTDPDVIMTKEKYDSITRSANVLCDYCENTDCENCIVTALCDSAYADATDSGIIND